MERTFPVGADAVLAPKRTIRAALRLALLRARARGRLTTGCDVRIGRGVRIAVAPGATVELADDVVLAAECRIEAVAGAVRLDVGARLGERAVVTALAGIELGAGAIVGDDAVVTDGGPSYEDPETPLRQQPPHRAPVRIGPRARLGAHAAVGPGVTVGAGAVIGSYAVIERDVPAGAVVERNAGNAA